MKYHVDVRLPLAAVSDQVKELEGSLNQTMHGFGFDEKVCFTSVLPLEITSSRPLTGDEIRKCIATIEETIREKFGYARVESFAEEKTICPETCP